MAFLQSIRDWLARRNRAWRVAAQWTFHAENYGYFPEYRGLLGWHRVGNGYGYLAYERQSDALDWIDTQLPHSVERSAVPDGTPRPTNWYMSMAKEYRDREIARRVFDV